MSKPKFVYNLHRQIFDRIFDEETRHEISSLVEITSELRDKLTVEYIKRSLRDAEGVITGWGAIRLEKKVLDVAPHLKVMIHSAGTVKPYISEDVWDRNIRVTSASHINAIPVAEYNLGMILLSLKRVFNYQHEFREKGPEAWKISESLPGGYKSKVGIIGMGNIGRHLISLLQPFDLEILIVSRYFPASEAKKMKAQKASLEKLLATCDIVTLCAANIPRNRHMINRERLSLMKDGAVFINTSRGSLVDEEALIAELQKGRINAVLDVFSQEPPPKSSLFYTLPNVVMTPHIAGSINEECKRLGQQALKELKHYLAGEPFENEVTREMLEKIA